jgi:tRNA threonylcarbamoyl adenosine modification protein YeaZ
MELAIDTSTVTASVALASEGRLLAEVTWRAGQRHSASLLPQVQHLLDLQGESIGALHAIAVAHGPGSFNGLRTGLATAKGLCFALDVPLIGLGTLEVAAYPFALTHRPICPVIGAGRGEVAVAVYQLDGDWRCLAEPQLVRP